MMKIVKTNLKFKDLGTKPFAIETAPEHIKLHSVSLLVGKRGSGKSFFASNLLDWLDFDRIIIVSPTYDSNYAQFKRLGVAKEDIFDPDDPQVVQKIIHIVNTERDELVDYRQRPASCMHDLLFSTITRDLTISRPTRKFEARGGVRVYNPLTLLFLSGSPPP